MYCDTDSIIFIYDENDPNHKLPPDDMLGDSLGAWEDELKPEKVEIEREQPDGTTLKIKVPLGKPIITEGCVIGAKSYGYVKEYPELDRNKYPEVADKKYVVKLKGITLDERNSKKSNSEALKTMVLDNTTLESEERHQFKWNTKTKDIETKQVKRTIRCTLDSKRLIDGLDTKPFI